MVDVIIVGISCGDRVALANLPSPASTHFLLLHFSMHTSCRLSHHTVRSALNSVKPSQAHMQIILRHCELLCKFLQRFPRHNRHKGP